MSKKKLLQINNNIHTNPNTDDDIVMKEKEENFINIKTKPKIKNLFTKEEDKKIIRLVKQYGKKWKKIAEELGTKQGKQIRERYVNNLSPNVKKEKFNINEELKIYQLYKKYGNKWTYFTTFLPGRSADTIKNRFNSSIKKKNAEFDIILALNDDRKVNFHLFIFYSCLLFMKYFLD